MVIQQIAVQKGLKHRLYRQMEPAARDKEGLSPLNLFIVIVVVLSLIALALETEPTLNETWRNIIDHFNVAIVCIFAFEYFARVWAAGADPRYKGVTGRLKYMCMPYAVADLIAFLPELLWMLLVTSSGYEEGLMMLRVLRLARLVKIARFFPAVTILGGTMRRAGGQLLITLAVALALVYISAVLLYFIEGIGEGREEFGSIPRAIWWAIATLTTVGYGDVYPITTLGRVAASVIALAGIGVVALPAGVFASAFSDELREYKRNQRREEAKGPEDGSA